MLSNRSAIERAGPRSWRGRRGLPLSLAGIYPRARAARLGHDPDESRRCARKAWRAGERDGAARGGHCRLSRSLAGINPRARAAPLGRDPDESRPFALVRLGGRESGTARLEEAIAAFREALQEYTRARRSFGPRARTISALRSKGSASGRAGRRGSRRRLPPIAKPCRKGPARACRLIGPLPR